jgi:hypothetical protein
MAGTAGHMDRMSSGIITIAVTAKCITAATA